MRRKMLVVATLVAAGLAGRAMATSSTIEIPGVAGGDALPFLSYTIGAAAAGGAGFGIKGSEARASSLTFGDLAVTRAADGFSPLILQAMLVGIKGDVVLTIVDSGGLPKTGQAIPAGTTVITLGEANVSGYTMAGSGETPTESISFTYQKITIETPDAKFCYDVDDRTGC